MTASACGPNPGSRRADSVRALLHTEAFYQILNQFMVKNHGRHAGWRISDPYTVDERTFCVGFMHVQ